MSVTLKAQNREQTGSLATKKIKREGLIPAIIYGDKSSVNLSLNLKEFESIYSKGEAFTSVIEIDIDGKKNKVIAHTIDLDPVSDRPIHVDFFNCDKNSSIRAKPKLTFVGKEKSPGLKKGGFLHVVLRRAEVVCDNESVIPHEIEINASKLSMGSIVRSENVELPKGVKFSNKTNFLIASITGRGKSDDKEEVAAEEKAAEVKK
jgi:large subunit ribosomal protein L25